MNLGRFVHVLLLISKKAKTVVTIQQKPLSLFSDEKRQWTDKLTKPQRLISNKNAVTIQQEPLFSRQWTDRTQTNIKASHLLIPLPVHLGLHLSQHSQQQTRNINNLNPRKKKTQKTTSLLLKPQQQQHNKFSKDVHQTVPNLPRMRPSRLNHISALQRCAKMCHNHQHVLRPWLLLLLPSRTRGVGRGCSSRFFHEGVTTAQAQVHWG